MKKLLALTLALFAGVNYISARCDMCVDQKEEAMPTCTVTRTYEEKVCPKKHVRVSYSCPSHATRHDS